MSAVLIVGPDDGERIQLSPSVQMRVLEDGRTTEQRLGMSLSTLGPHTSGPPQHRHLQHDEGFYVISGLLRFTIGDQIHDASPGTLVMVPPGAPHTFANPGDEPAQLLTTFTPGFYVQYFRDMSALATSGPPSGHDVEAVMARYATEISDQYAP